MNQDNLNRKLNGVLANAIVSYQKLHHFHWQVTGDQFYGLHVKFEELYDRFSETVDEVAERILMIGGSPLGTLAEALETASIKENPAIPEAREMVAELKKDFEFMLAQIRDVIGDAENAGDRGTANLLDGIADALDKDIWMLSAYLK